MLSAAWGPDASAQSAEVQEFDEVVLEEVIVTGSRIPRADIDSASPVTVFQREDIEVTGMTDIGEFLQRMPAMSGSPIGTTTNNGGDGDVLIDLRGMGPDRTLTLINGRRVVENDYQAIPSTMIERIEVLKDGASAVYGADAVAGVVNIITRRDFEGVEVTAQYSDYFDMDAGTQYSIGLIAGAEFDRGNIVFGLEYVDQEASFQSDAPWDFFQDSFYIYPEGCENQVTDPYNGTPQGGCYPLGSSRIPESHLQFMTQGRFLIGVVNPEPYGVGLLQPHDGRSYNYSPINYIQTPYERTNLFAEGHFELNNRVRFNFEIRGNYRESAQQLAPLPYDSRIDPGYQGVFDGIPYTGISEENYYLRRAVDRYNAETGADLAYEPVRDARRRMIETARRFTQEVTQFQWVAGLEGEIGDYDWEVFVNQGLRSTSIMNYGQFWGPNLANALGPSADLDGDGRPECYGDIDDPNSLIPNCVPFNMFGGGEVDPVSSHPSVTTVTPDMLDYLTIDLVESYNIESTQVGAAINGSNFELPGGPLGWAAGYGYWRQELDYMPDSAIASRSATGGVYSGTSGKLTNHSAYVEFLAPLWDNGTQNFYLKGGLRYDEWDAFDGDWTWQLGLEFQALDSLKFRGTAGTVFRVPTIWNLFGGLWDGFESVNDPCHVQSGESLPPGCDRVSPPPDGEFGQEIAVQAGGNPNLVPETGDTFTAGIVWTPQWGEHGFTVTVDYWEIELDDGISRLFAGYIIDDCAYNANPKTCALVTRDQDYAIVHVFDVDLNVAGQGAKGVDTELRWDFASGIGQWQASLLWAHMLERSKVAFEGDPKQDLAGRYTDQGWSDTGAYATDKANFTLQWFRNDLSVAWLAEYISGLDADTWCNCDSDGDPSNNLPDGTYIQDIDSHLYHDLVASYEIGAISTKISAGITNITDEPPPFIEIGWNATTDPPTYRMFGRGYYLRLAWTF